MNTQPVTLAPTTIVATDAHILNSRSVEFLFTMFKNLRAKANLGDLKMKKWTQSKSELITRILHVQKMIAANNTTVVKPAIAKGAYDKKRNAPKVKPISQKTIAKKLKKTAKTSTPRNDELSKYIASRDLTPKQARSKFRRAKVKKVDGHYVLNAETKKALA